MKDYPWLALALAGSLFVETIAWSAAAEGGSPSNMEQLRALEAASRYSEAWDAADAALDRQQGEARKEFNDFRERMGQKTGVLSLRVEPAGAEVFIDGVLFGQAPVAALKRVNVGVAQVRVTKTGYEPFVKSVQIAPDGKAIVSVALVRESSVGTLRIRDEAGQPIHVILDGVDIGAAPVERDVSPGKHLISGAGLDRAAPEQEVDAARGRVVEVALPSRPISATVAVSVAGGKGVVRIDGAVVGEGAFQGTVRLGVHRIEVSREGFETWGREVVLHDGETFTQAVTLEPPARMSATDDSYVPPNSGWYGGFGFLGSLGAGGAGSELEVGCVGLGAASCATKRPLGGGITTHFGYDFDPIGFEIRAVGAGDYWSGTASFDGDVAAAGGVAAAAPVREESLKFVRLGGTASLQVRASWKPSSFVLSGAVGAGASYRAGTMLRTATVEDPALSQLYAAPGVPPRKRYISPALTGDLAIGFKMGSASWMTVGIFGIIETAGNEYRSQPGESIAGDLTAGAAAAGLSAGLPAAAYHFASGIQYLIGPEVVFRYGH